MPFVSRLSPPEGVAGTSTLSYWFVFQGDQLLVRPEGDPVPLASSIAELGVSPLRVLYLGLLESGNGNRHGCYAAEIAPSDPLPAGLVGDGLRQLYPRLGEEMFGLAGRSLQIAAWDRTNRYCSQCGAATESMPAERAKRCPSCGRLSYPRISPAIIIAITRQTDHGSELLLARNHRFPAGRFSVLAGFVEPGETLEDCARREVLEEVGIRIRDIHYFGSQPWPFPDSLMIGFTAQYDGGELVLEEAEIAEAHWFTADALPDAPFSLSISRRLIDWFAVTSRSTADANGGR